MKKLIAVLLTLALLMTGLSAFAASVTLNGWQKAENGKWQYFRGGRAVTEKWIQSGDDWYYLDADGYMVSNDFLYLTPTEETDEEGNRITAYNRTYFMKEDGTLLTGWYYYSEWECWIYANEDGTLPDGWLKVDGDWYYFWDGTLAVDTIIWPEREGGSFYAVNKSGLMMENDWVALEYSNGHMDINGNWVEEGKGYNWYYAGADGVLLQGWQEIDGEWYFFYQQGMNAGADWESSPYMIRDGFTEIYGKEYFFTKSGVMKTGWVDLNAELNWGNEGSWWQYYGDDGCAESGWFQLDGKWYYADPGNHRVHSGGVYLINGKRYAFNGDCSMVEGWYLVPWGDDYWAYSTENGLLTDEWKQIDGNWYYFGGNGVMIADQTFEIDGVPYTFDAYGVWKP